MKNKTNESTNNYSAEAFSDIQKLQFVHGYIYYLISEGIIPNSKEELENYFKTNHLYNKEADIIFQYISDIYGYSAFPQVLSSNKYNESGFKEYYRGFKDISHIVNAIAEYNRHYGWGMASSGMHCADNFEQALNYTSTSSNLYGDKNNVLKFKLGTNKIISIKKLQNDFTNAYFKTQKEVEHKQKMKTLINFLDTVQFDPIFDTELYVEMFSKDAGKLGIILGYDAIDTKNWHSVTILNRSKMLISEPEYNRIMNASNNFDKQISSCDNNNQPQN